MSEVAKKLPPVIGGHIMKSWFKKATDQQCREELTKVIAGLKTLNKCLRKVPDFENGNGKLPAVPIRFDYSSLEKLVKDHEAVIPQEIVNAVTAARQGKAMGALTEDQVYTLADAICTFFDPEFRLDLKVLILLGLTQLGKTPVFAAIFLTLPVCFWLIEKKICIPTLNTPSDNNIYAQILAELQHTYSLLQHVRVVNTDTKESIRVHDYFDTVVRDAIPHDDNYRVQIGIPHELVRPRNRGWKEEQFQRIAGLVKNSDEKDIVVLSFSDECHEGQARKGFIDKREEDFYDKVNYIHVNISASPDEHIAAHQAAESQCRIVKQYVPTSYCGLPYYAGYRLPTMPGYKLRVPKVWDVFKHFPKLKSDLDPNRFIAAMNGEEDKTYMETFADDIALIVSTCVTGDSPIFFLRPFPNNKYACEVLSKMLAERLVDGDTEVLPYYGTLDTKVFGGTRGTGERRTIKQVLLDQYVALGKNVVVVSCFRSRRGDSYPKQCKFFMDLTLDSVNWNTFIQSTFGRACGHFKYTTCIFRPEYLANLLKLLEDQDNGYNEDKSYGPRTAHNDGRVKGKKGRPSVLFTAVVDDRDANAIKLPAKLRAKLDTGKILYDPAAFAKVWDEDLVPILRQHMDDNDLGYEVPANGDVVNHLGTKDVKYSCKAVDYRYYTSIAEWEQKKSGGARVEAEEVRPLCVYRFLDEKCKKCGEDLNKRRGRRAPCCLQNPLKCIAVQFHLRVGKARKTSGLRPKLLPRKNSRITKLFPEIEAV